MEASGKTKIKGRSQKGRREKKQTDVKGVVSNNRKHDGQTKASNLQGSSKNSTREDVVARKLRSLKPINSHGTSASINLTKEQEHVPVYKQNLESDKFLKKKNIDVYEFSSDEKEKKKKKKRTSDASFKVKLPRRQKKVTWIKKAEEILKCLGIDRTSKTLKEDVGKLTEARNKTNERIDSSEEQPSNKKINIISHIIIPPSTPSVSSTRRESFENDSDDSFFIPSIPIANSTMISNKVTPWRLTLPARCNPHFLKVKSNALPSVDQDPILDATFTKNAVSKPEEKTSQVQSSIFKFVKSNKSCSAKNDSANLFDIDEYSPFKNQGGNFENMMNNSIETNKREKSRRNLLQDTENCERIENLLNTASEIENRAPLLPLKNTFKENIHSGNKDTAVNKKIKDDAIPLSNENKYNENSRLVLTENSPSKKPSSANQKQLDKTQHAPLVCNSKRKKNTRKQNHDNTTPNTQKSYDFENYFGFTSVVEETLKTDNNPKAGKGEPTSNPFVVQVDNLKKADESEVVFIDEYSKNNEKRLSESESEHESQLPLFVDLKPKMSNRSYQKKIRKDRRRQSDALEDESNYVGFKHKDKKAKKEWSEEAENWAEQFNSICQEVQEYELEIE